MNNSGNHLEYVHWPATVYQLAVFLFVVVSAWLAWPLPEAAFRSDNSPVSWLSSAQLWALFALAIRLSAERTLPVSLGLWLSIAMAGMAFDEQFMLHEQWKFGCADWVVICRHTWGTELPMLLVGALGLLTAVWLHCVLPRGLAKVQMWAAICTGLFALSLDLSGVPSSLVAYEEGFEVVAEAILVGVFLGLCTRDIKHGIQSRKEDQA